MGSDGRWNHVTIRIYGFVVFSHVYRIISSVQNARYLRSFSSASFAYTCRESNRLQVHQLECLL